MGIVFAAGAYALSGVAVVIDKILLQRRIPSASAYVFFVGILGIFAFALAPFGFSMLPIFELALALSAGAIFIAALLAFCEALRREEPSRIAPLVGALIPVFLLLFAAAGLGAPLKPAHIAASALFIGGGLLLASPSSGTRSARIPMVVLACAAGALFAFSFLLLNEAFKTAPFVSVFIWSRLGSVGAALALLLLPAARQAIFSISAHARPSSYALFFFNKGLSATSFLALNYAIALGPLVVVSSLKGIEYLIVFLAGFVLTVFAPQILTEKTDVRILVAKIGGIGMIAAGFAVVALT